MMIDHEFPSSMHKKTNTVLIVKICFELIVIVIFQN